MDADEITPESLIPMLFDARRRAILFAALRAEQGFRLPLINKIADVAPLCVASADDLERIAEILLNEEDGERVLDEFLFHPGMPDHVLDDLLERGRCIDSLGHRTGPQELLEKLASRHGHSEAITTLALDYYADPRTASGEFAAFVRKHKDDFMLRYNLRRSSKVTGEKRELALAIVGESETR